jgi:tetratricopeptide (TPR) repeat protein
VTIVTDPDPSPRKPPMPPHESASAYDPTGIDDGKGGIALGTRRPALRATAWIALIVVIIAIAALAWRTMERKAVERAYTVGVKALADGRPDDARVAFDRAIAQRPEWGAAWRQRGFAAAKPADAIADFSRAIALDGNDGDAYAARGRAWMQSQVPAKAIGDLDRALAIAEASGTDPATVAAWRAERAAARAAAGDFSAALDDLRSVAAARGTPDDHRNLASALASDADWHGARDAYDRAIAASPQAQWFGERALVQIELGNDEAAGDDLERCAREDATCAQNFGALAGQRARDLGREPPPGAH